MPPALLLPKPLQVSERREPGHPTACSSARRGQALAVPEPQACRQADRVRASASSAALSVSYSPKYASSETPLEGHAPVSSPIHKVHSPEELRALVAEHRDQLSVLMCKAKSCRPCKAFSRRYLRLAEAFQDCCFLSIYGDETPDTRKLMMSMEVTVTPTFMLYRGGQRVHSLCGINEDNLRTAIEEHL